MKLFETNISNGLTTQLAGGAPQNNLIGAAAKLISEPDIGGFYGLVRLFSKHGQGDTMLSWVSTGANQPIAPDTLEIVLGHDRIEEVARAAGISEEDASYGLARVLPQLVDNLTPDGKLPEGRAANDTLSQLTSRFRSR